MIHDDEKQLFQLLWTATPLTHVRRVIVNTSIDEKRVQYILEKWTDRGIWNYGISAFAGWFETDLSLERLDWFRELSGMFYHEYSNEVIVRYG
jgi:hypothetical protein